jgi:hypothetical protein
MKQFLPIGLLLVLAACGDGKKEAAEQLAAQDTVTVASTVLDLARYDVPFALDLGDMATLGVDSAQVKWNEEFGWLEVRAGEHFAVTIAEEPGDLARLKADLDRSTLQTHSITKESPDLIVYRSQFPDEDLVFVHYYQVVRADGRTFVVQDAQGGRFNEADVERMSAAVRTKPAV